MKPNDLVSAVKDPAAWRLQSIAMRRAADTLWEKYEQTVLAAVGGGVANDNLFEVALQFMQSAKLLYGLALETAFKSAIVENNPQDIDLRLSMNGLGEITEVEVKSLGVPGAKGHDLESLAEKVGVFGVKFEAILVDVKAKDAFRQICRHLGEMVIWRGRYPAPMRSFDPLIYDPAIPMSALNHYMRDWLDPMLDELLVELDDKEAVLAASKSLPDMKAPPPG